MKRKTVLKRLHSKIKSFSQITPEHEYHMMKNDNVKLRSDIENILSK